MSTWLRNGVISTPCDGGSRTYHLADIVHHGGRGEGCIILTALLSDISTNCAVQHNMSSSKMRDQLCVHASFMLSNSSPGDKLWYLQANRLHNSPIHTYKTFESSKLLCTDVLGLIFGFSMDSFCDITTKIVG